MTQTRVYLWVLLLSACAQHHERAVVEGQREQTSSGDSGSGSGDDYIDDDDAVHSDSNSSSSTTTSSSTMVLTTSSSAIPSRTNNTLRLLMEADCTSSSDIVNATVSGFDGVINSSDILDVTVDCGSIIVTVVFVDGDVRVFAQKSVEEGEVEFILDGSTVQVHIIPESNPEWQVPLVGRSQYAVIDDFEYDQQQQSSGYYSKYTSNAYALSSGDALHPVSIKAGYTVPEVKSTIDLDYRSSSVSNLAAIASVGNNESVYHDSSKVTVHVILLDEHSGVVYLGNSASAMEVVVELRPNSILASAVGGTAPSGVCRPTNGRCSVSVSLRSQWFPTSYKDNEDAFAVTVYAMARTTKDKEIIVGPREFSRLRVHPRVRVTNDIAFGDYILATLPAQSIHHGESFSVPVYFKGDIPLATFTTSLKVLSTSLAIQSITLGSQDWRGTPQIEGTSKASAVVAVLRDLSSNTKRPNPELLFTVRLVAKENAQVGAQGSYFSLSLVDADDLQGSKVTSKVPSVLVQRNAVSHNGTGYVTIQAETPKGFVVIPESTKIVNTAVLNGQLVSVPFRILEISSQGQIEPVSQFIDQSYVCASSDNNLVKVNCTDVFLDGSETGGLQSVMFTVRSATLGEYSQAISVWFPDLNSVDIRTTSSTLRRINGWYDASSKSCDSPTSYGYQKTKVTAHVTFSAGASKFTVDLAPILNFHSSDDEILQIFKGENGQVFALGIASGDTQVTIIGSPAELTASVDIRVTTDIVTVSSLRAVSVRSIQLSSRLLPNSCRVHQIETTLELGKLLFEGDTASISVEAFLSDGSSFVVESEHIRLESGKPSSVIVDDRNGTSSMSVPVPGASDDAVPILVQLQPNQHCVDLPLPIASTIMLANVDLPKAERVTVAVNGADVQSETVVQITSAQDPAALGLVSTEASISVSLHYPDAVRKIMTSDSRTHFVLSAGDMTKKPLEMKFNKDANTLDLVVADGKFTGSITLLIHFDHEDLDFKIQFEIVALSHYVLKATPWPTYSNSDSVQVTRLHHIYGTEPATYESAEVRCSMVLSNGDVQSLFGNDNLMIMQGGGTTNASISKMDSGSYVVMAKGSGRFDVQCYLRDEESAESMSLTIADDKTYAHRITDLAVWQDGKALGGSWALRGQKGKSTGEAKVTVTMSNGRMYTQSIHVGASSLLPGLFRFTKDNQSVMVDVESQAGTVTLKDNHPYPAIIEVTAPGPNETTIGASTSLYCNLDPISVGDVDLGASEGNAVPLRQTGDSFVVDVRINTGGNFLGPFDLLISFDHKIMTLDGTASFNSVSSAISTDEDFAAVDAVMDASGVRILGSAGSASTIKSPEISRNTPRHTRGGLVLFRIKMKAKKAGVSVLSGKINTLGDVSQPPKLFAASDAPFVAGKLIQVVKDGFRRLERSVEHGLLSQVISTSSPSSNLVRRRNDDNICAKLVHGDVNGDCKVDIQDVSFLQHWVGLSVKSEGAQKTKDDLHVLSVVSKFQDTPWTKMVDLDLNGVVQMSDALFLLRVLAGKRFIFSEIRVSPVTSESNCLATAAVDVFLPTGTLANCLVQQDISDCNTPVKFLKDGLRIFGVFTQNKSDFTNAFFEKSGLSLGSFVSSEGGSPGAVVEAELSIDTLKEVNINGDTLGNTLTFVIAYSAGFASEFPEVGLSFAQGVREQSQSDGMNIFGDVGAIQYLYEHPGSSTRPSLDLDAWTVLSMFEFPGQPKYSPFTTFTNLATSEACLGNLPNTTEASSTAVVTSSEQGTTTQAITTTTIKNTTSIPMSLTSATTVQTFESSTVTSTSTSSLLDSSSSVTSQATSITQTTKPISTMVASSTISTVTSQVLTTTMTFNPTTEALTTTSVTPTYTIVTETSVTSKTTSTSSSSHSSSTISTITATTSTPTSTMTAYTMTTTTTLVCPENTFKLKIGSSEMCKPVRDCMPGSFEIRAPTQYSDRECADCEDGISYTFGINHEFCMPCEPACYPGAYLPECKRNEKHACVDCELGMFSASYRATQCEPWAPVCESGQQEALPPSSTQNRICVVCPTGWFRNRTVDVSAIIDPNPKCTPHSECSLNEEYIAVAGTLSSDTVCKKLTACTEAVGIYEIQKPTASTDRFCSHDPSATVPPTPGNNEVTQESGSSDDSNNKDMRGTIMIVLISVVSILIIAVLFSILSQSRQRYSINPRPGDVILRI